MIGDDGFERRCPCGSGLPQTQCCVLLSAVAAPQPTLPDEQAEPGLPALLGALRPAEAVSEKSSRTRDTQCGHRCTCTSDMECPHYECGCGEDYH